MAASTEITYAAVIEVIWFYFGNVIEISNDGNIFEKESIVKCVGFRKRLSSILVEFSIM